MPLQKFTSKICLLIFGITQFQKQSLEGVFLRNQQNSQGKVSDCYFNLKRSPLLLFSYEFYKTFQNSYSMEYTWERLLLLVLQIQKQPPEVFCKKSGYKFYKIPKKTETLKRGEALAQVFSCEFWKIPKNTFFMEHLRRLPLQRSSRGLFLSNI